MPLRRGRGPEFFEEGGEVHPIRNSEGYDPDVEKIRAEDRRRERSEEAHRYTKRERESIRRPPWAKGMTQERIEHIAREAGRNPYQEGWWQGAELHRGTGEYAAHVLEGGGQRAKREKPRGLRRGEKLRHQPTAAERAYAARIAKGADLPF